LRGVDELARNQSIVVLVDLAVFEAIDPDNWSVADMAGFMRQRQS